MLILGGLSFTGVGGIVKNAREVIDGNKLDSHLALNAVVEAARAGEPGPEQVIPFDGRPDDDNQDFENF